MIYIITLFLTYIIIFISKKLIKKFSILFYFLSITLSYASYYYKDTIYYNIINNGYLSLALFIIVMYIGVFERKNKHMKKLYAIRGELSIIAFIILIAHGLFEVIQYAEGIFYELGILLGIISFFIMIPLFITSFIAIRKRMNNKKWKSLHRWSYIVYLVTYLHIYLIAEPTNQILYTITFSLYSILRFKKAFKNRSIILRFPLYLGIILIAYMLNSSFDYQSLSYKILSYFSVITSDEHPSKMPSEVPKEIPSEEPNEVSSGEQSETPNDKTNETPNEQPTETPNTDISNKIYNDGIYYGSAPGYKDLTVKVNVEVKDDIIKNIIVLDCGCKLEKYSLMVDSYAQKMIDYQSAEVDAVSGSSYSVPGLYEAVTAALEEAKI